ncbi:SLATT domain-containing protein [Dolichospermum sp. UHCC 0259]|uniref:SLATT domain-containing protein n=1 Tax=Dolichospermum sp. UHCC 0259 TaxID=2590010 RepID=UPI0014454590|nr:SLATT domain-containing protein [Dolichospermum sp. UHCC 0259]MTJ46700.1 SLATT domain-containing protein [Dolichospermum sp. UHCC 0259]
MSNNNTDLKAYSESLMSRIWKTKSARFNAARRLKNKYQFSISSISILSVYGIAIPIIQSIVKNPACQRINDIYNAISLILSVFTLAISLEEGSKNYELRAEKLYNNAVQLSSLQREMEYLMICGLSDNELLQKLGELSVKYDQIIKECPENHEPEDYDLLKAQNIKDFKITWIEGLYIQIKLILKDYWLYIFVVGIPPILFMLYSSC